MENKSAGAPPPYEGGSGGVDLGSSMRAMPSAVYFQQPSAADITRMTMFQLVDEQGRLLFTCTLNRIPRALVGPRSRTFKTEYTLTDSSGRTVLVALADGSNIAVTGGDRDRATIGFIDGGNYDTPFKWITESSAVYTGHGIANGVSTFKVQRTGGPAAGNEFVLEQNGTAVGVMKRNLPNCPETHSNSFGIKFPEYEMEPQTRALIIATGVHVFDNYFMLTTWGDGGVRGAQLIGLKRVGKFALIGFVSTIVFMIIVILATRL